MTPQKGERNTRRYRKRWNQFVYKSGQPNYEEEEEEEEDF
jgi:hypothetical protein